MLQNNCVPNFHSTHKGETDSWSPDEYQFEDTGASRAACPHPPVGKLAEKCPEIQQNAAWLSKMTGWLKLVLKV
jgi:hypothetical protein